MATIHKKPSRSGAKSASAALEELIAKSSNPPSEGKRKAKSAKSGKNKKGKKAKKGAKRKSRSTAITHEQLRSPAAMTNAHYICHNAPDFLQVRGFKFKPKSAWETVPAHYKLRILGYN